MSRLACVTQLGHTDSGIMHVCGVIADVTLATFFKFLNRS